MARAIYASQIPVASGIGHEVDFTIADFVADYRAPTPSAAAEMVSPDQESWKKQIQDLSGHFLHLIELRFNEWRTRLEYLKKRLHHPGDRIKEQMQRIDLLEQRFRFSIKTIIKHSQQQLYTLSATLNAISPLKTLERGYSILTKQKTIIRSKKQVKKGDQLSAQLSDGVIECEVK